MKSPKNASASRLEGLHHMPRNLRTGRIALTVCFSAVVLTAHTFTHAVQDEPVRQALALVEAGQAQKAFDLLAPLEAQRAGDPDFDAVLGIAANLTDQFTRAVFALERVLLLQPGNTRARAELGRALFAMGDHQGARAALEQTKMQGVPVQAAKSIDEYLQAINRIDASNQASVQWYLEAGLGHDSNVNSSPPSPDVAVPVFGGLVFTLNPDGVQKSADYWTASAGVSARVPLAPRWAMIGSAGVQQRRNQGESDVFNTQQIDVSLGGSYRVDKNELSFALQLGENELNHQRTRSQRGIVGEWIYRPDGFGQWGTYIQHGRLSYPSASVRDADRTVLGSNYAHLFRTGLLAYGGAYAGAERKRSELPSTGQLGHKLWGLRAGVQQTFSNTLAVFGNLSYESRTFGAEDPIFLTTRKDQQSGVGLGLHWVPAPSWRITPQVNYTRSESNIVINDFSKTAVSVTARRDF
jgi:outer membrane protein